jgi:RNA polymerase sigma-70 factor (ECF subfamily)
MDFERLIESYEKPIYNLILRLTGSSEEAEDLTQETFVSAYKSYSEFRGEASVYTWLYRIAINKCKNKFKERDRHNAHQSFSLDDGSDDGDGLLEIASEKYSPEIAFERKELKERILQAINRLPGDYRIIVVLRDLQGLSYQEIAQVTELSVDMVRTRLARGRAMLRSKLEHYISDE